MRKILLIAFTIVVTSLYFFPFNIIQIPGSNTKMILAAIGLFLFFIDKARSTKFTISKEFLILSIIAAFVSLAGQFTMAYNHTKDNFMAEYIISLWVWMGGAYAVLKLIKLVHGKADIQIIGNYLVSVCTIQCAIAYISYIYPPLQEFKESIIGDVDGYMGITEGRLSGIGASLDPAGLRFAAVLIILTYIALKRKEHNFWTIIFYFGSFAIIGVIGNMMSRTTSVGILLSLILLAYHLKGIKSIYKKLVLSSSLTLIVIAFVLVISYLYKTDAQFHRQFRFGFELFFNLSEKGRLETNSSNFLLEKMIVWPESLKTWLIGDGFALNQNSNLDYFGKRGFGFYMSTDIGYLRYIYYFGLIGLTLITALFVYATAILSRYFRKAKIMFLLLLVMNLIGWLKVSSDIIMVFCPFLVLMFRLQSKEEDETNLLHSVGV
ncbi:MAG: hypothetical protein IKI67_05360 [Bacteroidales bacterium]|nr:hypothetical protein [Bacteroidales bacterium]